MSVPIARTVPTLARSVLPQARRRAAGEIAISTKLVISPDGRLPGHDPEDVVLLQRMTR